MYSLDQVLAREAMKVADLERLYVTCREVGGLVEGAVSVMRQLDSDLAWRAVWILKRAANDGKLSASDVIRIATVAEELPHWAARLILCQLFAATGCPAEARERLFPYLLECFANRRPMIRAWAVSAMVSFGADPRFSDTIETCLAQARTDRSGSVQARLRRLKRDRPGAIRPRRTDRDT